MTIKEELLNKLLFINGKFVELKQFMDNLLYPVKECNDTLPVGIYDLSMHIISKNTNFECVFQQDGNLVVYDIRDEPQAIWSSGTYNKEAHHLSIQDDGNIVIYDMNLNPLWATHTNSQNVNLKINDDGTLTIYAEDTPLWSSVE
jgi:hypothetical protein